MKGRKMFVDGKCKVKYTQNAWGAFDKDEEMELVVNIGNSSDTGEIYLNGKTLIVQTEEFFEALKTALNNLSQ